MSGKAQVEIDVWLGGEPGTINVFTELAEMYMAENPGVRITTTFIGSDLFGPTLVPALSAGEGPDIFQTGTGPGQPAAIIGSGLALDLTQHYFERGWDTVIPSEIVTYTSSDGKLWSVGHEVESTAMFFNEDVFDEHGLAVPRTWAEFEQVLAALIDAGFQTPIGLGGGDQWPISHWQSMLFGRFAGPDGIDEVMYGDGRWDAPAFVEASQRLQDMASAGYFGPNPLAVGFPEVMDAFWRGDIPMTFTGPWVIPDAVAALGDDIAKFDIFQIPPVREGDLVYPTEDIGSGFYISSATEHPDVAADILDFYFFDPQSRLMLLEEGGNVPVGDIDDLLEVADLPLLQQRLLQVVDDDRDNGTIHAFLDTVQPANLTTVTYDGLQALIAGVMSPEQFLAEIQAAWEDAKARNLIMVPGGVVRP